MAPTMKIIIKLGPGCGENSLTHLSTKQQWIFSFVFISSDALWIVPIFPPNFACLEA